jgi:hypothetical protein
MPCSLPRVGACKVQCLLVGKSEGQGLKNGSLLAIRSLVQMSIRFVHALMLGLSRITAVHMLPIEIPRLLVVVCNMQLVNPSFKQINMFCKESSRIDCRHAHVTVLTQDVLGDHRPNPSLNSLNHRAIMWGKQGRIRFLRAQGEQC